MSWHCNWKRCLHWWLLRLKKNIFTSCLYLAVLARKSIQTRAGVWGTLLHALTSVFARIWETLRISYQRNKKNNMSSSPRNSFNHNDKNLSLFILQMYFLITLLYTSRSKQQLKITGRISAIHLTVWHSLILWMLVSTLYWYKNDLMIVSMIWTDHKTECHSILLQVRSLLERNTMVWTSSPDFCSS